MKSTAAGDLSHARCVDDPPGIPLLIPGERFNKIIVDYLGRGFQEIPPLRATSTDSW